MKEILLPLLILILCETTTPQPPADRTYETKPDAEMHAVVTDLPSTVDMAHADPKNWYNLPLAVEINGQAPPTDPNTEELRSSDPMQEAALAQAMVIPGI